VVVAGTHGKTTVTATVAWILLWAGLDPGFLIGGAPKGFPSFRVGGGEPFVIEGDEYDSCFYDKRPKFLSYEARVLIVNSVEFDHADIYPDLDSILFQFRRLVLTVPGSGRVIVGGESPHAVEVTDSSLAPVESFGLGEGHTWGARQMRHGPEGCSFTLLREGAEVAEVAYPGAGDYSVRNALAAWAACSALGVEREGILDGLASFPGVRRRLELRGEIGGVAVVEDFAHHPTAIRETLRAARQRFEGRRLWACFEPRSWTCRRSTHQTAFPLALAEADHVLLAPVFEPEKLPADDRLDTEDVAETLREGGVTARACSDFDEMVKVLLEDSREGDVILLISNGAFGGIQERILDELTRRQGK
jgi:UDP-N-acetylmuramate: L-alanyl-gamma-D-glutamyl-meso-diaminopimelate ligase